MNASGNEKPLLDFVKVDGATAMYKTSNEGQIQLGKGSRATVGAGVGVVRCTVLCVVSECVVHEGLLDPKDGAYLLHTIELVIVKDWNPRLEVE